VYKYYKKHYFTLPVRFVIIVSKKQELMWQRIEFEKNESLFVLRDDSRKKTICQYGKNMNLIEKTFCKFTYDIKE